MLCQIQRTKQKRKIGLQEMAQRQRHLPPRIMTELQSLGPTSGWRELISKSCPLTATAPTHAHTCIQNKQNILIIWFWSQWLVDFDYMLQEFFFLMALPAIFSLKDCFLTFCSGSSISDTENEAFQPMRGNEYLAPTWTQHDAWLTGKTMNRIFWE